MKAMAAVVAMAAGETVNVSAVCRQADISRKTFYKWLARVRVEGVEAGLAERSRRPHRFPRQVASAVEDDVVRLRKELADDGHDHGAATIQWHLGERWRGSGRRVPSEATIHRILVRRGQVVPAPKKRPKSSWRRFEASVPNEWWQVDSMEWHIATGAVQVINMLDDHSRVATASRAVLSATSEAAWTTFCLAGAAWGLPAGMLSDNGLCFSGKLRGFEVLFETNLRAAGVRPFTGRPYHPQTTGKVERFQQTLKKWLRRRRRLAADIAELQTWLDEFRDYYNHQRPHQGIGRRTPISRWEATPPAGPANEPIPAPVLPTRPRHTIISNNGVAFIDQWAIHVGRQWAGADASVFIDQHHATVFAGDQLARHLRLDPTRRYQPSARDRKRPT